MHVSSPYSDESGYMLFDLQGRYILDFSGEEIDLSPLNAGYYLIRSIKHPSAQFKILKSE